jgi:hypothetical protein
VFDDEADAYRSRTDAYRSRTEIYYLNSVQNKIFFKGRDK